MQSNFTVTCIIEEYDRQRSGPSFHCFIFDLRSC
jgi:hypothetical protein